MAPDGRTRVRLTRSGVVALVAAALTAITSRVIGVDELAIVGGCLAALVGSAWLVLLVAGTDLDVARTIRPHRVTVGDRCTVDIVLHNGRSVLRLPVELTDSLDGEEVTRMTLPQGRRDPAVSVRYELPTRRRGIVRFGPLGFRVLDPFGLARVDGRIADMVDVIVLPRVVPLDVVEARGSEDPAGSVRHRRLLTTVSEEFESLREYVPGDDVRRVHWASTARLGRPMVRNHQQPTQRRTTVVLDDRHDGYGAFAEGDAFERAVTAAASVLWACRERGDLVRLMTASGDDTGMFDDEQRFDSVLDELAAARLGLGGSLAGALRTAGRNGDRVVACAGVLDDTDLAALATIATQCEVIVVGTARDREPDLRSGLRYVPFAAGDDLGHRWSTAGRADAVTHSVPAGWAGR